MTDNNTDSTVIWLGLATFVLSMLFVWQGLDFTDMGFWLTGYQQFYSYPESIGFSVCWLSYFIGHWVGVAFGGGVLAYKLGYVAVVTLSAMVAYRLLASQLGYSRILAAMVLLTVFFTRGLGGNWIDYNDLTALFYLVGAGLLFWGLTGNRKLLVMLAGIVLGANVFVRFPNLLGITLISAIWLQAWIYRWALRGLLVWSAWFLGGFALGMALIWGLIALHGHEAIYFQGIQMIFGLAADDSSHHPGWGLLKRFISDHVRAFAEAFSIGVIGVWIANWVGKQQKHIALVTVLFCALLLAYVINIRDHWHWFVPGICYVVLLSIVFLELRKETALALLSFIAGMLLLLVPLGSNNGIYNAMFGMWLALPLTLTWLWQKATTLTLWRGNGLEPKGQFSIDAKGFHVFAITITLTLLFQSLILAWRHTHDDNENRLSMTYPIAHTLLVGTYTTAERAKVVTELLDAMSHFAKPGDEMLTYNAIPTLHFLTETHPWLGDPWQDYVNAKKIATQIRLKEQTGAKLPNIVRAKRSTYNNFWPIGERPVDTYWHQDEPRKVFAEFEQRHGYAIAWSNDFFEILTIPQ